MVVSSLTFRGVPSGTDGELFCAHSETAIKTAASVTRTFFMTPPADSIVKLHPSKSGAEHRALPQIVRRGHHLLQGCAIALVITAVNEPHVPFAINHQRRRMRDVESIQPHAVIQAVGLRDDPVFIQQKRERDRILLQELHRLEDAIAFFRRDVGQLRSRLLDLTLDRLDPSHALDAIRSPRAAQELQDERRTLQKARQRQNSVAICRVQRKLWRPRAYFQSLRMIEHLFTDCKTHQKLSQPAKHAWEPQETSARRTPRVACTRARSF